MSNSEIEVSLNPGQDPAAIRERIDELLGSIPGITTMVGQPIEHRLSHVLSGTPAAIAISVYGDDLSGLRRVAKQIEQELSAAGTRTPNATAASSLASIPLPP